VELLESLGVTVLAAIIVVSRNSELTAADCNLPLLFKLSSVDESLIKVWDEDKCPLCASQEPMRPGIAHNDEFLDANPNYPKLQD
jgi:orotate phosphoribosyltransferase